MRALPAGLAVLVVCFALGEARADDGGFTRPGVYLGVGASRSANLVEAFFDGTPVLEDVDVSNSWGVNARLGYRVAPWFAVEAEYEWLDPMNASLNGVHVGTLGIQSATVNLRLIGPFGRFQPYFLLGAGAGFFSADTPGSGLSVDHSAFAGRVGLGIDVYLIENLYLNLGAEALLSTAEVRLNTGSIEVSETGLGGITFQTGLGFRF